MKDFKQEMLNQMIRTLEKLEIKYHLAYEDKVFTNIVTEKKVVKRRQLRPRNELRDFVKPQLPLVINTMSNGYVDCDKYSVDTIQSWLSSHLGSKFGTGLFSTSIDKKLNCVWFWGKDSEIKFDKHDETYPEILI